MDFSRPSHFLTPHSFVAVVEETIILLDSRSDDYIMVESRLAPGLLTRLSGADPDGTAVSAAAAAELAELIGNLERHGAITADPAQGKPLDRPAMIAGSLELPGPRVDAIPCIGVRHVAQVTASIVRALYLLKLRGLRSAIAKVEALRRGRSAARDRRHDPSELVEIFLRLRPFFYSARGRCLLNSLSLILFLAKYDIFPCWCFGVRIRPFAAHCWAEDEDWLYDDEYCNTWRYTPILRV